MPKRPASHVFGIHLNIAVGIAVGPKFPREITMHDRQECIESEKFAKRAVGVRSPEPPSDGSCAAG